MRKQPKRNNIAASKKARAIKKIQNKRNRRAVRVAVRGGEVELDKATIKELKSRKIIPTVRDEMAQRIAQ